MIGSEEQVREAIQTYESAGVTDFGIQIGGENDTRDRTAEFVAKLAGERAV